MRILGLLILLLAAGLVAVPTAAADIIITVKAPTAPIPWDAPTSLDVSIQTSCATVAQAGTNELELVVNDAPPWLGTSGPKLPFTTAQCDQSTAAQAATCTPQPQCAQDYPIARSSGKINLTPTKDAPAFKPVNLVVTAKGQNGRTNFTTSIAYHGSLNATSNVSVVKASIDDTAPFTLLFEAFTNGHSLIRLDPTERAVSGTIEGMPESLEVNPPVSYIMNHAGMGEMWMEGGPGAGKPQTLDVRLAYHSSPGPWTGDNYTIAAVLTSLDDSNVVSTPVTLRWSFEPTVDAARGAERGSSPAPAPVWLAAALLATLALFRKKAV